MKCISLSVLMLLLASCSHNGLLTVRGKYFGLNQTGFTYANGLIVADMSRENTSVKVKAEDKDGLGDSKDIASSIEVERTIGKQCTGYLVDLAKESPEAAEAYISNQQQE